MIDRADSSKVEITDRARDPIDFRMHQ